MRQVATAVVFVGSIAAAGAQTPTSTSVLALEAWVASVRQHAPGKLDPPVQAVRAMTFEDRRRLNDGFSLFLGGLTGKGVATRSDEERRIAQIARDLAERPGAAVFLKQAAVLHSDAAMIIGLPAPRTPRAPRPSGPPPGRGVRPPSPLLTAGELLLEKDGEVVGRLDTDWNWPFARSLLDLVHSKSGGDPFVAAWYHATTAHMLGAGAYGEATTHLAHAGVLLPADARILFDRACLSEINGLPRSQQLLTDKDRLAQREISLPGGRPMPNGPRLSDGARASGVPPAEVANREAEDFFRRALDADAALVEARVRLARLLTLRKRYADAIRETDRALSASPEPTLAFLARMFAARAERALGHVDAAAEHIRQALVLFPDAQSAHIAASHLALVRADLDGALAPVARLRELADAVPARPDPWWNYALGPGRVVEKLLAEMWAAAPIPNPHP